jgi:hypothetical protein
MLRSPLPLPSPYIIPAAAAEIKSREQLGYNQLRERFNVLYIFQRLTPSMHACMHVLLLLPPPRRLGVLRSRAVLVRAVKRVDVVLLCPERTAPVLWGRAVIGRARRGRAAALHNVIDVHVLHP